MTLEVESRFQPRAIKGEKEEPTLSAEGKTGVGAIARVDAEPVCLGMLSTPS